MCILLVLDVMSCRYLLSSTGLLCHLIPLLPYWFSVWMIYSIVVSGELNSPTAAAAAKLLQSCSTLCDPIDGSSLLGCPVPGILQARTLEWVAISFSNAWKWKVKVKSLSRVRLLANPWTAAYQAPPSMGFSRQEYWSGVPSPFISINIYFIYFKEFSGPEYWNG